MAGAIAIELGNRRVTTDCRPICIKAAQKMRVKNRNISSNEFICRPKKINANNLVSPIPNPANEDMRRMRRKKSVRIMDEAP